MKGPMSETTQPAPSAAVDSSRPNSARVWNYWQGGKDNYEADRAIGDWIARNCPLIVEMAHEAQGFTTRAVHYLACEGIEQYIDIGCGIPAGPAIHEMAGTAARAVYVDVDPIVLAHARALLATDERVAVVEADLRDVDTILSTARGVLDLTQPVAVLYRAVLPHIVSDLAALDAVQSMMTALPSGSHLVIAHDTADEHPEIATAMKALADQGGPELTPRSRAQVEALADGMLIVPQGSHGPPGGVTGPPSQSPGRYRSTRWSPATGRRAGRQSHAGEDMGLTAP